MAFESFMFPFDEQSALGILTSDPQWVLTLLVSVYALAMIAAIEFRRQRAGGLDSEAGAEEPTLAREIASDTVSPHTVSPHTVLLSPVAKGLSKTSSSFLGGLRDLFAGGKRLTLEHIGELEELLIRSDVGVRGAQQLLGELREKAKAGLEITESSLQQTLKQSIEKILHDPNPVDILARPADLQRPKVIVVVGVNGVGKTTTIAKLAKRALEKKQKVLLAACDTFRAAASDQLKIWADRAGVEIVEGSDNEKPSTVAYRAIERVRKESFDILIIDTAGRLHTKANLMNELSGVVNLVARELPGSPDETLLVLDATTGQNAIEQAREFHSKANVTGLIVTKLDGTARGGIVVQVKSEFGIPVRFIGVGEGIDDLKTFDAHEFVEALFAERSELTLAEGDVSHRGRARRKRREEDAQAETADLVPPKY